MSDAEQVPDHWQDDEPTPEVAESVPEEATQVVEPETPEEGEQEAPEEAQATPTQFTPEQQEVFNKAIGEKVAKMREIERQAEEERKQREELAAKLAEYEKTTAPSIPPMPDYLDDDYEAKVRARDEAIMRKAEWDAKEALKQQQEQAAQYQRMMEEQQAIQAKGAAYKDRAVKLGIGDADLQVAGMTVAQSGISQDVAQFILDDEHGPAITMALSKSPLELDQLRSMNPLQAAVYIEKNIKPRAVQQKVQAAPPPVDTPSGGGVDSSSPLLKGAKFS